MKAMILAAGRGERLRPLTDSMPKPLLTVGEKRLIEYHLETLSRLGVETVVINTCYLAEQFKVCLGDGSRYGLRIEYSPEEDACLGTGGGIHHALPLLGDEPFIVMSADVWSQYSFPASFMESENDVHLVLVDNPVYHPAGDYALTGKNQLSKTGKKLNYSGIAKLHPRLFRDCEPGNFSLSVLFNQAIKCGAATGEYYKGPWFNVGTAVELAQLELFLESSL